MRRWFFWIALLCLLSGLVAAPQPDQVRTRIADGFDQPVGKPDAEGYYKSRGFLPYHPGEDWNGLHGGNSDLGAPVYAIANGYVTFARDARMGWGNVVLIRHIFMENGRLQTVDSMYAHLDKIVVREGQQMTRGQQVGTIGTNRGMYVAHLHFEIRKNLDIGINRSAFRRDLTNYYRPGEFIASRRKLAGGGRSAMIAVNTYRTGNVVSPPTDESVLRGNAKTSPGKPASLKPPPERKSPFRVNRFEDF
ncbi:MAG: M23 family metallopeptidase [Terrimicrobiaceae bacterium]|jgi:murein DD-endopeptidase MepM/ murein hydrolase activator NlpD|nr:M23 family metallopeptidase [Terrimicrobiaceae bacterium]